MQLGLELARLTAGLDKLYRDVPRTGSFLDREGLIPVAVAQIEPYALKDYAEARDRLEARVRGATLEPCGRGGRPRRELARLEDAIDHVAGRRCGGRSSLAARQQGRRQQEERGSNVAN